MGTGPGPKPGGAHFEHTLIIGGEKRLADASSHTLRGRLEFTRRGGDRPRSPPAGAVAAATARNVKAETGRGCIGATLCIRAKKGVKKRQLGASSDKKREKSRKKRPIPPCLS